MLVYVYQKCSTCKNALKFLRTRGVQFTEKEITKEPPSMEELKKMLALQNGQLTKLFNTSGLLYKQMQLKDRLPNMQVEEALDLLSQHGMLVKRPFILGDRVGLLGFREKEWSTFFS